jgi:predicted regulator of Ras-like GTPase activity (Roadblock/LC7/MglB family)
MTQTQQQPISAARARAAAQSILDKLDGAHAVLVATVDGFPIADARQRHVDIERMAAIVSSFAALGEAASRETAIGQPRCLVIESTEGRLVTRSVRLQGSAVVLAVLADTRAALGLVWAQLRQAESELAAA